MGYLIGRLASLPVLPDKKMYLFLLGKHRWQGGELDQLAVNFDRVAREMGPNGAIIMGHDGVDLTDDLMSILDGNEDSTLGRILPEFVAETDEPAILVLNRHPQELKRGDSILLSPLSDLINRAGGMDSLLSEICRYAGKPNDDFIKLFQDEKEHPSIQVSECLELKPNIFGIGLNINAFIDRFRKK